MTHRLFILAVAGCLPLFSSWITVNHHPCPSFFLLSIGLFAQLLSCCLLPSSWQLPPRPSVTSATFLSFWTDVDYSHVFCFRSKRGHPLHCFKMAHVLLRPLGLAPGVALAYVGTSSRLISRYSSCLYFWLVVCLPCPAWHKSRTSLSPMVIRLVVVVLSCPVVLILSRIS